MKKKILSLAMAAAMVLSISSVSQAADNSKEFTVNGTYTEPTLTITMSGTSGAVAINPYGLDATVTGVTGNDLKEKLVNKVETITNGSAVAVAVNATVSATPAGSLKLATAAFKDPLIEKTNSVFAFLHMEKGATGTAATIAGTTAYDSKAANQVLFGTKAVTKKAMVTLDKTGGTNPMASFKIVGDVAPNPTTPWTTEDKVDFNIVFDFEPRLVTGA